MEFKIYKDEEVRYDIASYCTCTDEQKNLIWLNIAKIQYKDTSLEQRVKFEHTSRLVKAYIEAEPQRQRYLWELYDNYTQLFCDRVRWRKMMADKKKIKEYFQNLIPDQNETFYREIVEKHYLNTHPI